jgi:hypothetical protein
MKTGPTPGFGVRPVVSDNPFRLAGPRSAWIAAASLVLENERNETGPGDGK